MTAAEYGKIERIAIGRACGCNDCYCCKTFKEYAEENGLLAYRRKRQHMV
jgi:hypothetical protein